MKTVLVNVALSILCVSFALPSPAQALGIEGLKCEYLANPLGVDSTQPRLSWILQSSQRGQRQTAYQILAATTPERLAKDTADLWDSGKVASDQTIQVAYAGQRLRSKARVFWKVRVWDQEDQPSAWSAAAHWQMGLLKPSDWKARWIAHPASVSSAVPFRNGYHCSIATKPDTNKWVQLDLGRRQRFDAVRLFPARPYNFEPDTPGFLFPLRFRIEVSDTPDFGAPRVVVDQSAEDVPNPGTNAPLHRFKPVSAQYVRLFVTRLRSRGEKEFGFALAEMQVLSGGKNLATHARVVSHDSIEQLGWLKAFLVDGDLTSHAGTKPEAQPVTMLRKGFHLNGRVQQATAFVSALGVYELHLNGQRVGDHVLPPEWTDYATRVQYQTYDVTTLLHEGENAVGAWLGDGWYAGRIGIWDRVFGLLRGIYGPKPYLLAQLEIELANGQRVRVVTDGSWRATKEGPIRSSDLLDGEVYDARREITGWGRSGFLENYWQPVEVLDRIAAKLVAQPNEPIRVIKELKPTAMTEPKPGVFVFDLGQNLVGRCRLELIGTPGITVTLRHAEMTNEDGSIYVANLRRAPQVDRYTCRSSGREVYEPAFTQHGFRYVEVTGLKQKLPLDSLVARVFNSAAPEVGHLECSDPMLNQLWQNILWTQRGNLMSVPTDCPQRDERLGWTGDIQAFSQTALFNMDLAAFFTKWLRDLRDNQSDDGRYPDFAPHPGNTRASFSGVPAWADAGTVVPWRVYQNHADTRLLREHFESARRWVDYIHAYNPDLVWRRGRNNNYNDWLNGDTLKQTNWPAKGGEVPKDVFATAFFAHSTELVAKMADVLDRPKEAKHYGELFSRIKAGFNQHFVKPDGRIQGDTQAGYALALNFNLLSDDLRPAAARHMVEGIQRYSNHISTGIQTIHRLMEELTRYGYHEVAWQLLTNRAFPSWGYMIENGATTIWERWDGYVKGRGFQDPEMNSFNHWALGAVGEWMWRHIVGLNPDESHPGYQHFLIAPRPGGGVTWAKGEYHSIRGRIASEWKLDGEIFTLHVTVPPNTTATVRVPAKDVGAVTESGQPVTQAEGVKLLRMEDGQAVFAVNSGRYAFEARSVR